MISIIYNLNCLHKIPNCKFLIRLVSVRDIKDICITVIIIMMINIIYNHIKLNYVSNVTN